MSQQFKSELFDFPEDVKIYFNQISSKTSEAKNNKYKRSGYNAMFLIPRDNQKLIDFFLDSALSTYKSNYPESTTNMDDVRYVNGHVKNLIFTPKMIFKEPKKNEDGSPHPTAPYHIVNGTSNYPFYVSTNEKIVTNGVETFKEWEHEEYLSPATNKMEKNYTKQIPFGSMVRARFTIFIGRSNTSGNLYLRVQPSIIGVKEIAEIVPIGADVQEINQALNGLFL